MDKKRDKIFLVSPGHGGVIDGHPQTPGKRSPIWGDGEVLFEGECTRAIVNRIEKYADAYSVKVINLVPTRADWPLKERVSMANSLSLKNPDNDYIYLSIHCNAGGGHGIEVFTSPGQTASDAIATEFLQQLSAEFPEVRMRTDMSDGDPDKEARFYELTKTIIPAVLTENFFMDNEVECREFLMTEDGRDRIAMAHLRAMAKISEVV